MHLNIACVCSRRNKQEPFSVQRKWQDEYKISLSSCLYGSQGILSPASYYRYHTVRMVSERFFICLCVCAHRSLKFGPKITSIASKPKAHNVIST